MILHEHKRVKHGHMPGDIPKRFKIAMREKRVPVRVFPWQVISADAAKQYRRDLAKKGRKVQRRRDRAAERNLD